MEPLWTWLTRLPPRTRFSIFSVPLPAPVCAGFVLSAYLVGTWAGSTGERPGSTRWNQTVGRDRTVGIRRRPVLLRDPGLADQPVLVRRTDLAAWQRRSPIVFVADALPRLVANGTIRRNVARRVTADTRSIHAPTSTSRVGSAPSEARRFREIDGPEARRRHAERPALCNERGVQEWPCTLLSIAPLRLVAGRWLRSGIPASPEEVGLRLLPSGPDRVHSSPPRGTFRQHHVPSPVPKRRTSKRNSTPLRRVAGTGHR